LPTKVRIGETDLLWLYKNHDKKTYSEQADRLGCCVDTLKRILVREGLQEFDGAKYQVRRDFKEQMWSRPCMDCGDNAERPKNHYFCKACRKTRGYED